MDRGSGGLIREIGSGIEEEMQKVESELMVVMADMVLEKTRKLRMVGVIHPSTDDNCLNDL